MNQYCVIEVAIGNEKETLKIRDALLEDRLVASCQIVNSKSKWRWHGELEESSEFLLIMRTKKSFIKDIYAVVQKYHSYDTFEFAVFDFYSPNSEYLDWIDAETKEVKHL